MNDTDQTESQPRPLPRILVVEDERPMRIALRDCLDRQGYRVLVAEDGATALEFALREHPDLIVLDIMMPRLDGLAVCAELRRLARPVPVLMLTAKGTIEDRVRGLDVGADDYLVKPFSREELLARVRALLRRTTRERQPLETVAFGDVRIDFVQRRAWRQEQAIELTAKEFEILRLLLERPGEVISRDRFLDVVWGYTAFPTTRTVDRHIATLRTKLGDDAEAPRWIRTVHRAGYRFEAAVDRVRTRQDPGPHAPPGC
jgi:DNA-binding response OmpR family regulator